jgi:hypothetical protein
MNYTDTINLFKDLHTRQDEAVNCYRLEEYIVLKNKEGNEMKNTSKIILNHPRVFGDAILSILSDDNGSYEITGVDESVQSQLEKLFTFWFYLNDETLGEQLIEPLKQCFDFQSAFRGWLASLNIIYRDGSKYLPVCMPMDGRWMIWEVGSRGLKYSLNWIRLDKSFLEETYQKKLKSSKKKVTAACLWDDKNYKIFESDTDMTFDDKNPIFEFPHNIGFCPVHVTPVTRMPYIISTGQNYAKDLSYWGEDIYAPVRKDIKYMNELASIWATINRMQFETPMQLKNGEGTDLTGLDVYGYGMIVGGLKEGQEFIELPTKEMSDKAILLFREIFNRYEQATLSSVNYGQAGDRQSALAIADLKSDRGKVINPLRRAESKHYKAVTNQWRRQINAEKFYETDIKNEDAIDEIDKSLFEKKFVVNIRFDSISPQENMANAQLFAQLKQQGLDEVWLLENILHVNDPQGLYRRGKQQRLIQILPEVELAEAILEWEPGDVSQKEINEALAMIGKKALREKAKAQSELRQPVNQASQPNIEYPTPNSNTQAQRLSERTGQAAMKESRRAKGETSG